VMAQQAAMTKLAAAMSVGQTAVGRKEALGATEATTAAEVRMAAAAVGVAQREVMVGTVATVARREVRVARMAATAATVGGPAAVEMKDTAEALAERKKCRTLLLTGLNN